MESSLVRGEGGELDLVSTKRRGIHDPIILLS